MNINVAAFTLSEKSSNTCFSQNLSLNRISQDGQLRSFLFGYTAQMFGYTRRMFGYTAWMLGYTARMFGLTARMFEYTALIF